MIKKVSGQSLCSPLSYWRSLPSDGNPSVTRSGKVRFADNPLGGFIHGCFQRKNVHDALNNAMPGQRKRGYNQAGTWS
jgi:hypothetical protein